MKTLITAPGVGQKATDRVRYAHPIGNLDRVKSDPIWQLCLGSGAKRRIRSSLEYTITNFVVLKTVIFFVEKINLERSDFESS